MFLCFIISNSERKPQKKPPANLRLWIYSLPLGTPLPPPTIRLLLHPLYNIIPNFQSQIIITNLSSSLLTWTSTVNPEESSCTVDGKRISTPVLSFLQPLSSGISLNLQSALTSFLFPVEKNNPTA
ncbi:hypothetical protein AMECASPLE_038218 [Ameca splendens]|uniref:Uncharacterized protein n=1 Tax=Ameca splendens TaxID=208324 RepID=A0ABV0Z5Z3_9TELE